MATVKSNALAHVESIRLIAMARPGDQVSFLTPQKQVRWGRVVFAATPGKAWLVLNCGGRHGTPAVVYAANIVEVRR